MEKNRVNLNKATRFQLSKINGIGSQMADEIIEYRVKHGGFKDKDELSNVPGFDHLLAEKVKAHTYVD